MALISMAVYSTDENNKDECLSKTLRSLVKTVDFNKHRLILSVNGKTDKTEALIAAFQPYIEEVIWNKENLGTAGAINLVWKKRVPGENVIKMDDDVVIHQSGWVDQMEEAIAREPKIGIVGLKRKDCAESVDNTFPFYKSELIQLNHKSGEKWIVVEKVNHVMGTCQMYSDSLLQKIGYLYQPKLYGFDDSFASFRSDLAGFWNVFLFHIEIDHIDKGDTTFQKWKEAHASSCWGEYHQTLDDYKTGRKSIYHDPF